MTAPVLVGHDLVQGDRPEAGPVGLVDRVVADAGIANAQVFFVLPAVVAEADLQPEIGVRVKEVPVPVASTLTCFTWSA